MLRAWVDDRPVGVLARLGSRGSTFAYDPAVDPSDVVSLTMPTRVASWDSKFDLVPLFDMNLPEGALRERLTKRFAKATGTFDDLDLLAIVGRSQIGRVRLSAMDGSPSDDVPFHSVDEILKARRGGELLEFLMDTFAVHSGLSGVQPKAMVRGETERASQSLKGATHIVKMWEAEEYPELAANEFFCLTVARRIGLDVPDFKLSDTGDALVVERFDLVDGRYIGFEDFCVLNAAIAKNKYAGGYETKIFKRLREFLPVAGRRAGLESVFKLFVLNCAIRNGDAHLKNFGLLYDRPTTDLRLAPVYDLVTSRAYMPKDAMALTLNGSTDWPDRRKLQQLGLTRADLQNAAINDYMVQVADTLSDVAAEARQYFRDCPHPEVGDRMLAAWEAGVASLGFDDRTMTYSMSSPTP